MPPDLSRRHLITSAAVAAIASGANVLAQPATQPATRRQRPPALSPERVREFVGLAHSDVEGVRRLLREEPALINATWDWGGGDFESAIGAAAHMGRADIALLLLENKARMDIPVAAMLGQLAVVKAACEALPGTHLVPGAHGIPLIEHARKGGPPAEAVLKYLESLR
jgi:hypothetical protein